MLRHTFRQKNLLLRGVRYASSSGHTPKPIEHYNKEQVEPHEVSLPFSVYRKAAQPPKRNFGMDAMVAVANGRLQHEDVRDVRDSLNMANKHAVITGASGGLGLEYACTLIPLGMKVHVVDLKPPGDEFNAVAKHCDWLNSTGRAPTAGIQFHKADVTKRQDLHRVIGDIADKAGRLDVCIANAGIIGDNTSCDDYSEEVFDRVMKVNVEGVNNTAAAGAKAMKKHGCAGRLVFTASMSGSIINRDMGWSAYTSSKAAVKHLAKTFAVQLAKDGITVNSISPGHMRTAMTKQFLGGELENCWAGQNPLDRLGSSHELAMAIAYLCSETSTYTTGSDVVVDGGHSAW